ncbi:FAD-binding protein [Speluncibacter jeojiensis]|uniref:assimilatory sulfite reductase (NADPH) n=1 Tax=Speluncibacter jeojiensis TaxID=2710754 RepID=A0A9X4RCL3_9ACTN|nr:FAD-binding protein [Corynebacteriales bacterium D3-21]
MTHRSALTAIAEPAGRPPRRTPPAWNRKRPFAAALLGGRRLTGPASTKDVRHYTLDLAGSGLTFEVGDSVAVVPVNDPALVASLLMRLGLDGEEMLQPGGRGPRSADPVDRTLADVLTHDRELALPSLHLLRETATHPGGEQIEALLAAGDRQALDRWLWGRDVLDVFDLVPGLRPDAERLITLLHPLVHRAYSIASSPLAAAETLDLTVAGVAYRTGDRDHRGVCSSYLSDRIGPDRRCGAFMLPNKRFRLPADDLPVIMIGPGTGVAPFRAFLQERRLRGASGPNWLFFGDRNRAADFLYEDEFTEAAASGLLTRMDLAFSRDQAGKVYVQHRMRDHGRDLLAWLDAGAHLYVCGDAQRMAGDVDATLVDIVAEHAVSDRERAVEYVAALRREGRYHRDVY